MAEHDPPPAASPSPALRASEVTKSFPGADDGVEVLRGVTFEMLPFDALAITGPSGSGKSTLLHILGTLDSPTSGRVEIGGRDPFSLPEDDLARFRNSTIGFIFQDHHLLPQYDALENALIPALAYPGALDQARERALQLLDRVELSHRLHHRPAELSGGERQRVAVARALLNRPSLLLCDEPTGNLDASVAGTVASLLFDLQREEGSLLVVVTHSLELAARFPRRLQLTDGRCVEMPVGGPS